AVRGEERLQGGRRVAVEFHPAPQGHPPKEVRLFLPGVGEPSGEGRSGDAGDDGPDARRKVVHLDAVLRGRERREGRDDSRRTKGAVDPCLRGALVAEGPHLLGEIPETLRGNANLADEE